MEVLKGSVGMLGGMVRVSGGKCGETNGLKQQNKMNIEQELIGRLIGTVRVPDTSPNPAENIRKRRQTTYRACVLMRIFRPLTRAL